MPTDPTLETPTARVYEAYDLTHPPRHPGEGWTRFVCVSDTHSLIFPVPPGDVLLHSGDLSRHGTLKDLQVTLDWMKSLPHPAKFFIGGNHDLALDANYEPGGLMRTYKPGHLHEKDIIAARKLVRSKELRKAGMVYLEHESTTYTSPSGKMYNIHGSPGAPFFSIGAFQYEEGNGKAIYDRIPASTDILMTHTPPFGICDVTKRGKHAGCPELTERLNHEHLRKCKLHVYGHIHEGHGAAVVRLSPDAIDGRISVNAALPNKPLAVIVDLKD